MNRFKIVICFLLLVVLAWELSAQNQPSKPVARTVFATSIFDNSWERLPPGYNGHSVIDLWPMLLSRRSKLIKQEYETSEAWAKRIEKLQAEPFHGSLTVFSLLAFSAQDVETEYDADQKTLSVKANKETLSFDLVNNKGLSDYEAITWWFKSENKGSFIGSNSFGVKRKVRSEKEEGYYVLFKAGEIGEANLLTLQDVSVQQAKLLRPKLRVLVVGKLQYPYVGAESFKKKATIDTPVQTDSLYYYLYFKPEAFWFYNYETGEVYYRADLQPKEQAKK